MTYRVPHAAVVIVALVAASAAMAMFPLRVHAAVTFDAVGPNSSGAICTQPCDELQWSHTISGSNTLLVVGIALNSFDPRTITSVTFNGDPLTLADSEPRSDSTLALYYLVAPDSGTHTVEVQISSGLEAGGEAIISGSVSFNGVDQTTPVQNIATNTGDSNNPTLSVTSAVDNMAVVVLGSGETITADSQTSQWLNAGGGAEIGNATMSTADGAASVLFDYDTDNEQWAIVGLDVVAAAETPSQLALSKPPNNLGLAGYWSFNEGAGTVATDFSGNGNQGTLAGNSSWVNGKRGKAVQLDGSGDSIAVNTVNNFPTTGGYSASVWLKPAVTFDSTNTSVARRILNTMGSPNWYDGNINMLVGDEDTGVITCYHPADQIVSTSQTSWSADTWYHLACVYNPSDGTLTIYVNGVQSGQTTSITAPEGNNTSFYIGAGDSGSTEELNASVDEVRIYNRALGPTEVAALARAGAARFGASSADLDAGSSLESGLVGHWTFDGKDVQSTITDVSGSDNHAYFKGGATSSAKTIGRLGQAFNFDGSDDGVLTASNLVYGSNVISVAFWGYWTDASQPCDPFMVSGDLEAQAGAFYIAPNLCDFGDDLTVGLSGNSETARVESITRPTLNQWHHYVVVLDHSTNGGDITIYIDGASQSTTVEQNNKNTNGNLVSAQLAMMHFPGSPTHASGKMDDVRIYNRALTASEAQQLYNLGIVKIQQ